MVEYTLSLDTIFQSLSDPTRRDMLSRLKEHQMTVGELARPYDLTFAAISKHLKVLERAQLIFKRKRGKEQVISIVPQTLALGDEYLRQYQQLWEERFDRLDNLLKEI